MTVTFPVLLALALAPALFWFWFFARQDKHPEPAGLLLRVFVWGMLMVIPAGLLEQSIDVLLGSTISFVLIGVIEEGLKFIAASSIAKNKHFDEPIDGLIYATAAALGFATLENLGYMLKGGADLILVRGPISTLGHILFSLTWGYAMSLRRFKGAHNVLRRGWLLGALLHTIFNAVLISSGTPDLEWLVIPFGGMILVMWKLARRYYASAVQNLEDTVPNPKLLEQ
jgi:RsiW-degrading membrane proteinase PrsW (M82 family)